MSENQVSDLITDQEKAFALLVLSGAMTDRCAAEAVALNPDTAALTKAKPRVVAFMHDRRATMLVQQETEEVRRLNQSRERVLARLWQMANLDPEITRNSASAQIKALSMIVAIEGLIPSGSNGRRAGASEKKSALLPAIPQFDTAAGICEQQKTTAPDHVRDEDGPGEAADSSESVAARPSSHAETTPSVPPAPVSASAPENRVTPSTEKKPDTWRLRL